MHGGPWSIRIAPAVAVVAAVVGTSLAVASPALAGAGWGGDRGWFVTLSVLGDFVDADDPAAGGDGGFFVDEWAPGAMFGVGHAFTPAFAIKLTAANAPHGTSVEGVEVNHASAALEAHVRFYPGERAQAYLFGGFGGATLDADDHGVRSEVRGGLMVLGAGFLYHLSSHLALDIGGRVDVIDWNEAEVTFTGGGSGEITVGGPVAESGSAGKLLLGLVWSF
jgi:hypothetical protein